MKYRDFLKVVISAAVGAAIGGGAVFYLTTPREIAIPHVVTGPETVRLLVAKQTLSYGATLQKRDLKWVEWPKSAVPPGAFTSVEELFGEKGDQRRIVLRSIEPGEPVVEGKITKFGESPRMPMNLGAGMRAVTISIDAVSGVARFIAAGDRVDILLTRTQQGQLVSSLILLDITVIAVDRGDNAESSSPRLGSTVTVEVDAIQAQKLELAQQVGKLSLTLRGIGEQPRRSVTPRDGMYAVSIKIAEVPYLRWSNRAAGPVARGDQVDIRLTRIQEGRRVTKVILQNITVIAIDPRATSEISSPGFWRTVTVEVDSVQAQRLELAQQVGKLSLTPVEECLHYSRCSWLGPL
jgi:pilus assembly protein CpaB